MTNSTEQRRWRFQDRGGRVMWLPFDPAFLCIYCEQPVGALSMGGPVVCPACDCGRHHDGRPWTPTEAAQLYANAHRRLDTMSTDPVWDEYEQAHRATLEQKGDGK